MSLPLCLSVCRSVSVSLSVLPQPVLACQVSVCHSGSPGSLCLSLSLCLSVSVSVSLSLSLSLFRHLLPNSARLVSYATERALFDLRAAAVRHRRGAFRKVWDSKTIRVRLRRVRGPGRKKEKEKKSSVSIIEKILVFDCAAGVSNVGIYKRNAWRL